MKFTFLAAAAVALLPSTVSTNAFSPKAFVPRKHKVSSCNAVATISEVATTPIAGMKPGTSGLRKKVEIWQGVDEANKNYVENFIQSLLDTATENNGGEVLDT
jgi:phosphoglucomutase